MIKIRQDYAALKKPVLNVIMAEFFIQLISSSLLFILPLYMRSVSYTDGQIAGHISFRFLGVVLTTLPLGFLIKGRKLKGFFITTGIFIPLFTIVSIEAIAYHIDWLISVAQFFHGMFYAFTSVAMLPYILRNEKRESQTEAIALHFAIWSLGSVVGGWMIGFLNLLSPHLFTERNVLTLIGVIGFANLYFLWKSGNEEYVPDSQNKKIRPHKDFDWKIISYTLIPNVLIAIGAGLAIPFIGLFFANVHAMRTGVFALVTSSSSILVVVATLYIPFLKRRFGMRAAITNIQIIAVLALMLMAATEYFKMYQFAVIVAVGAYFIRSPLMNMVGPLTSELSMHYVGEKNREIVSALISAISSGGYFVSAIIFKKLRDDGMNYASIFFITATFYFGAVIFYYLMSGRYLREVKAK
ncbi:MAG TPA: MFS transporter [Bacteroidia bacterium]|jgi:predicted MFS family arabinose efflux permease|nr:MFS transporter [Bacteroidia bacterium]